MTIHKKLDEIADIKATMCAALEQGASIGSALAACGLPREAYTDWVRATKDTTKNAELLKDLISSVEISRYKYQQILLRIVDDAAQKKWQAAAWRLERSFADEFCTYTHVRELMTGWAKMSYSKQMEQITQLVDEGKISVEEGEKMANIIKLKAGVDETAELRAEVEKLKELVADASLRKQQGQGQPRLRAVA